jgi:NAD+ synthase
MQTSVEYRLRKEFFSVAHWIKNYFDATKKECAILGLSGGLDSALVLSLLVTALGPERIKAYYICARDPEEGPSDSYGRACEMAKKFGVKLEVIHIGGMMTLAQASLQARNDLARGNIAARLRMIALYDMAAAYNGLVVGTTNLSEWITGYFTKWGDGGVDIEPIKHFTKSEVWSMARGAGVVDSILNADPSAELWDLQTDEEELGVKYAELDAWIEGDEVDEHIARHCKELEEKAQHKIEDIPFYERDLAERKE